MSARTWVIGSALPIAVRPAGNALIGKNEPAKKNGTMATGGNAPMYSSCVLMRLARISAMPYIAMAKLALHVVLQRLTPAERTAFVLHDVFQYSFDEIAEIVGRTPAACRQLASRARRTIRADAGAAVVPLERAKDRRVTEQFIAACSTGDLDALLGILDPDVSGEADLGGGSFRSENGSIAVSSGLLRYLGPDSSTTLLSVPAGEHAGVLAMRQGKIVALVMVSVRDGRVHHIDALVDPVKLAPISGALGI